MEQFCIHCGKPVTSDARFCKYCGKEIQQDQEPTPTNLVDDLHYRMAKEIMKNPPTSGTQPFALQKKLSFFQILFSFEGRIGRLTYFLASIMLLVVETPIIRYLEIDENYFLINIVFLVYLWEAISIMVKRSHDLDRSPWWLLTLIIPLWNIITSIELLFSKGTQKTNKYGSEETQNGTFKLVGILALIAMVAIIISIFSV